MYEFLCVPDFGVNFNQSLDNLTWPAGLQSLAFGWCFSQSLDDVTWPAGLQSLTFGEYSDASRSVLSTCNQTPESGRQREIRMYDPLCLADLGVNFNQSLDNLTWPAGLQSLTFGWCFSQSLDDVTWPAGLQSLTFGEYSDASQSVLSTFNQGLDNLTWPAGFQSLTFGEISSEPGQGDMASTVSSFKGRGPKSTVFDEARRVLFEFLFLSLSSCDFAI